MFRTESPDSNTRYDKIKKSYFLKSDDITDEDIIKYKEITNMIRNVIIYVYSQLEADCPNYFKTSDLTNSNQTSNFNPIVKKYIINNIFLHLYLGEHDYTLYIELKKKIRMISSEYRERIFKEKSYNPIKINDLKKRYKIIQELSNDDFLHDGYKSTLNDGEKDIIKKELDEKKLNIYIDTFIRKICNNIEATTFFNGFNNDDKDEKASQLMEESFGEFNEQRISHDQEAEIKSSDVNDELTSTSGGRKSNKKRKSNTKSKSNK